MKTILVVGSARRLNDEAKRATRLVGAGLANSDFGLVTGSWRGVDRETAQAFIRSVRSNGGCATGRYLQIHKQMRWKPFSTGKKYPDELRIDVSSNREAYQETISRSDAAILIGGVGGAKKVAFELVHSGRPVFPLPLTGGDALTTFTEILEQWSDHSVPGLTRNQFMSLSLPLRANADSLIRLLKGALSDQIDVFLSYRRDDLPAAAGRLAEELGEHLGPKRVFLDTHSILPGRKFDLRIDQSLRECKVMICLIGPRWSTARLHEDADYVRRELTAALQAGKTVVPLVAFGGQLPRSEDLPESIVGLLTGQSLHINGNDDWKNGFASLLREVDRVVATGASCLDVEHDRI